MRVSSQYVAGVSQARNEPAHLYIAETVCAEFLPSRVYRPIASQYRSPRSPRLHRLLWDSGPLIDIMADAGSVITDAAIKLPQELGRLESALDPAVIKEERSVKAPICGRCRQNVSCHLNHLTVWNSSGLRVGGA